MTSHEVKRQLEEIRAFKQRSRQLFEQLPAIMFAPSGRISQMNPAAETALDTRAHTLLNGTLLHHKYHVLDETGRPIPSAKHPWIVAMRTRSVVPNAITGIAMPDGRIRWQQSTSMPLRKTERQPPYACITLFTDITRLKELQAQIIQNQKMEAVASLASGLTHDFNNILTSIRSAVQLLLMDQPASDPRREILKDVENETLRGAELIKQLMLFTKPAHASHDHTCLNQHVLLLKRLIKRTLPRDIHLHFTLSEQELSVAMNPTHFEQVLLNLIINARDAMTPAGGTLTVQTSLITQANPLPVMPRSRSKTFARIDVSDTGSGIDSANVAKIFEPFFTTKKETGGTGLGLAIVHNLVHRAGGLITVDSIPAKGTTFTILLPARCVKSQPAAETPAPASSPVAGFETILLVDDEELITKSTARLLERHGYHAIPHFEGTSALNTFKEMQDKISLVLLDMEMPGISGKECMEALLAIKPSLKIIVLSGHLMTPGHWDPVSAGARKFIQKPFDSMHLLHTIRTVLDS